MLAKENKTNTEKVAIARTAYDDFTENAKNEVTNYAKLTAAEELGLKSE